MSKRRGLGRGLDALLAGSAEPQPISAGQEARDALGAKDALAMRNAMASSADRGSDSSVTTSPAGGASAETKVAGLAEVPVDQIFRGQFQPRRHFDEAALDDLAASIKSQGLMQPIVLRPKLSGGYEIVAGERRWRAAQRAGLQAVPSIVRDIEDEQAMAMALIENIQREDLNPLEEALAMQRLRDEFELTQQELADTLGKNRATVGNMLRLLNLAPTARTLLERGEIEMGHARALLSLDAAQQDALAREVADRSLTVRETERRVSALTSPAKKSAAAARRQSKDADTQRLEQQLSEKLGAPVSIEQGNGGKGKLVIGYSSHAELDGILGHLN